MLKTIIIAAAAMLAGTVAGYLICGAAYRKLRRKLRALEKGEKKGMGVMDKVLVLEAVILILYTIADFVVFWHTGAEPGVLTGCVFGVCGMENGVMGWIKTNKDELNAKQKETDDRPPPAG